MSEAIAGLPPPEPPSPPRDAAIVLLVREVGGVREVFWVKGGKSLRAFAGFRAFPGGKVDRADHAISVNGFSGLDAALRASAVRELFEETGLLLALGQEPVGALAEVREKVLSGALEFWEWVKSSGAVIDFGRLVPAGRWITPDFLSVRFDAQMFLVNVRADERASVVEGELASGEWIQPKQALELWAAGRSLLHPPNLNAIQVCASSSSEIELFNGLRHPVFATNWISERIEFQLGIKLFPLRTPTLPPATHTNTYLVGNGELLIVDPGAADDAELGRLVSFLEALKREGVKPTALFLTHHHFDHVGGVAALRAQLKLPVWAHPATADKIGGAERLFLGGEQVRLEGQPPMDLEVLHTPGHARGHLCLYHRASKALVCGDMVAGQSTIIIDPPEGNLADYLRSLNELEGLQPGTLYQAHGSPIADGVSKLKEYAAHRRMRVEALSAALGDTPRSLGDLVREVYADVPEVIHPIAERSALASLEFLQSDGRAMKVGADLWFRARP